MALTLFLPRNSYEIFGTERGYSSVFPRVYNIIITFATINRKGIFLSPEAESHTEEQALALAQKDQEIAALKAEIEQLKKGPGDST